MGVQVPLPAPIKIVKSQVIEAFFFIKILLHGLRNDNLSVRYKPVSFIKNETLVYLYCLYLSFIIIFVFLNITAKNDVLRVVFDYINIVLQVYSFSDSSNHSSSICASLSLSAAICSSISAIFV